MKAAICRAALQFLQLAEEDMGPHVAAFVTATWHLLQAAGAGSGGDGVAHAALAFLTAVARSTHYAIFASGDTIRQARPRLCAARCVWAL